MIFTFRQMESIEKLGVENKIFYFPSKNLTPGILMKTFSSIRKEIKDYDPDLVHVHYGMIYAFVSAYSNCKPLVITFHGSDINRTAGNSLAGNIIKYLLGNLAVLRARKVICVSARLRNKFLWRRHRITVLSPGIDTELFIPMDRREARIRLNWDPSDVIVLFNGNNPRVTRLDIAEETITLLKKT